MLLVLNAALDDLPAKLCIKNGNPRARGGDTSIIGNQTSRRRPQQGRLIFTCWRMEAPPSILRGRTYYEDLTTGVP
jgi:hypothetical protein